MNTFHKNYSKNGKTLSSLSLFVDSRYCGTNGEKKWLVTIINPCGEVLCTLLLPSTLKEDDIYALFCVPESSYSTSERNENEHYLVIPNIGQQIQSIHFDFFRDETPAVKNASEQNPIKDINVPIEDETPEVISVQNDVMLEDYDNVNDDSISMEDEKSPEDYIENGDIDETNDEVEESDDEEIDYWSREYIPLDNYMIESLLDTVFKVYKRGVSEIAKVVEVIFEYVNENKTNKFNSSIWLKLYSEKIGPDMDYQTAKRRARSSIGVLCDIGLLDKYKPGHDFIYTVKKNFIDTFSK